MGEKYSEYPQKILHIQEWSQQFLMNRLTIQTLLRHTFVCLECTRR